MRLAAKYVQLVKCTQPATYHHALTNGVEDHMDADEIVEEVRMNDNDPHLTSACETLIDVANSTGHIEYTF